MLDTDVRLEWFVSFLAVVEAGSFVAAAGATGRSQPRVSQHVAALEELVGQPLFDRAKRPVRPTDAGQALAVQARRVLRTLEEAEAAMAPWRGGMRGIVRLGSCPSVGAAFVPGLLKGLAATDPDIKVVVSEHGVPELDAALASGGLDLYLRPVTQSGPGAVPATVASRPLWREPLVAVHAEDHPLAALPDPVPPAAVAEHPVVAAGRPSGPEADGCEVHRLFREHGLPLDPVQTTEHPQTLVCLAAQGVGVGVTNGLAAWTCDTTGVRVRPLEGGCERRVAVCWDSVRSLTPATRTVLEAIVKNDTPEGTDRINSDSHQFAGPVLAQRILT